MLFFSFWFIHNGFGLGAFVLLPLIALGGLHLLFNYKPFPLLKTTFHTVLLTVWISLFLGFVFQKLPSLQIFGGTFGYFGVQKLNQLIGGIGTFFLLLVFAVIYSIAFLNLNPFSKIKWFQKKNETVAEAENKLEPEKTEAEILVDDEHAR